MKIRIQVKADDLNLFIMIMKLGLGQEFYVKS